MLLVIGIIFSLIGVGAIIFFIWIFWDHIWYRYYRIKFLFGEIKYETNEFISYDFSQYNEKRIVGVYIGIRESKEQILLEALQKLAIRYGCSIDNVAEYFVEEGRTIDNIILDNFYIKNAIIPQNRITKKYGRYEGEVIAWTPR